MENTEMGKNSKQFDLGAILNITTGILFTSMDDVYEVLNYLTGDSIFIHQIPRVMDAAKPYVLSLHPELEGVGVGVAINSFEDAKAFVDEQKKIYGNKLSLTPMSKTDGYSHVDPIEEAIEIKSGRR